MEAADRTLNVLVVDERSKERRIIEQVFADFGHAIAAPDNTHESLEDAVAAYAPDVTVVGAATPDPEILKEIRAITPAQPVLLFTNDGASDAVRRAIECGVAAYIVDGIKPSRLGPIVEAAIARFQQLRALRQELVAVQQAAALRRRVDLAKGMLMCRQGIDERSAHRHLLKTAMATNRPLLDVADDVVVNSTALDG